MNKFCKVILAASAVMALAAPAMAVDTNKLIVRNAVNSTDVFTVDDAGKATAVSVITPKLGLGTTNPQSPFHNVDTSTSASRGGMFAQHNNGGQGASIVFRKSRGTEIDPLYPNVANDYIGNFVAQYWNGVAYDRSAQFQFRNDMTGVTGGSLTPGTTTLPTSIQFMAGGSSQANDPNPMWERMRISSNGNVVLANFGGVASSDLLTTATNGFVYIPNVANTLTSCATATTYTGHTPMWFDTANSKICVCKSGALKCTAALN